MIWRVFTSLAVLLVAVSTFVATASAQEASIRERCEHRAGQLYIQVENGNNITGMFSAEEQLVMFFDHDPYLAIQHLNGTSCWAALGETPCQVLLGSLGRIPVGSPYPLCPVDTDFVVMLRSASRDYAYHLPDDSLPWLQNDEVITVYIPEVWWDDLGVDPGDTALDPDEF